MSPRRQPNQRFHAAARLLQCACFGTRFWKKYDAGEFDDAYIIAWAVIGPFSARDGLGLDVQHPPDHESDFSKQYAGKAGAVAWTRMQAQDGVVNLAVLSPNNDCVAYAVALVDSPLETDVMMGIGSDDGCRVWLNDQKVFESRKTRLVPRNDDTVSVRVRKGLNTVKVKVAQGGGPWGFAVSICAVDGKPIPGLKCSVPGLKVDPAGK